MSTYDTKISRIFSMKWKVAILCADQLQVCYENCWSLRGRSFVHRSVFKYHCCCVLIVKVVCLNGHFLCTSAAVSLLWRRFDRCIDSCSVLWTGLFGGVVTRSSSNFWCLWLGMERQILTRAMCMRVSENKTIGAIVRIMQIFSPFCSLCDVINYYGIISSVTIYDIISSFAAMHQTISQTDKHLSI